MKNYVGGASIGVLAIALATPAAAQDAAAQPASTQPATQGTTQADRPQRQGGVQTIVVTAQRRNENLQDVPISVQALGEEQLDQLKPGEDLVALEHAFDNLDLKADTEDEKSE